MEKTTHIQFIIIAPGITKPQTIIEKSVDMTTICPTLCELCGLKIHEHVDGFNLVAPLRYNSTAIPPALMTYMKGNHAIHDERWRYIQYADGSEKLFDHKSDPNEWYNIAGIKENKAVITELKKYILIVNTK